MKYLVTSKGHFWARGLLTVFALIALGPLSARATSTEIIDATGDGAGNTLEGPEGIAVDGAGNVYVSGTDSNNVFKITPGGVVTEIIDASGAGGVNTLDRGGTGLNLWGPGIAVDGAGNVYVSGLVSNNAFKITPGGVITEIIDASGAGGVNTLDGPSGIAVDGAGNVYIGGHDSDNVFKITPGGVVTEIIDATGAGGGNTLKGPWGIAVDGAGNVYVSASSTSAPASHNVFKITPGGVITEIADFTGIVNNLYGIAVDGAGNVYVAGDFDKAYKITPGGVVTHIIDATGDGGGNTLNAPFGIAVDGAGNVYVSAAVSGNAFKITPEGVITQIIDSTGDGGGNTLANAYSIAVDGAGKVYVPGLYSDNAFKICVAPTISTLASPNDLPIRVGQPISFSAEVGGTLPLSYQWSKDGVPLTNGGRISGVTSATLTINPTMVSDTGLYRVTVTNACGSVTQDIAYLHVIVPALGQWGALVLIILLLAASMMLISRRSATRDAK